MPPYRAPKSGEIVVDITYVGPYILQRGGWSVALLYLGRSFLSAEKLMKYFFI